MSREHYNETRVYCLDRFMSKVDIADECWLWTAGTQYGYGIFSVGHRNFKAHRWLYEQAVEEVPEGLTLDHLCRIRKCVNPDHLEPVTMTENNRRSTGHRVRKTHCPQGHSYAEHGRLQNGYPVCRECDRIKHQKARQNKKEN
jgi:hypothetical protein